MINNKKEDLYAQETKIHESRHSDNQILMPDHRLNNDIRMPDHLSRAKDEIIAYLADGSSPSDIYHLLMKKGEGAYDYYYHSDIPNTALYEYLRPLYEEELTTAVRIASKMQQADIPHFLDILAITPVRQWSHLDTLYDLKKIPDKLDITDIDSSHIS